MEFSERIDRDLANGNHWLARQRIESHVNTKGYNAELLARAGQIAHDMHDDYNAGRLWLMSSATGPDVDRAIEVFMRHAGNNLQQAAWQVPRAARIVASENLPTLIRDRLKRLELEDAIVKARPGAGILCPPATWGTRLIEGVFVAVLVFGALVGVLGVWTIINWFISD